MAFVDVVAMPQPQPLDIDSDEAPPVLGTSSEDGEAVNREIVLRGVNIGVSAHSS